MSIITKTFAASSLKFVRNPGSSSWESTCYQGQYKGSDKRIGAMLYKTIRDIDWSSYSIIKIEMTNTYKGSGSSTMTDGKILGLYRGNKTSITGTGTDMKGEAIGNVNTNGKAFSSTHTITFDNSNNNEAFSNLIDWLQHTKGNMLVTYMDEERGSSNYSRNYLSITSSSLKITYEEGISTFRADKNIFTIGESVSFEITGPNANTQAHCFEFELKNKVFGYNILPAGITRFEHTIPNEWVQYVDWEKSSVNVICKTYKSIGTGAYEEIGKSQISFTVTKPTTPPIIDASFYDIDENNVYQYYTPVKLKLSTYSPVNAYITRIVVSNSNAYRDVSTYTKQTSIQNKTYDIGAHTRSGNIIYTITVTDSNGNESTKTLELSVLYAAKPEISNFKIIRTAEEKQSDGSYKYVEAFDGEYLMFSFNLKYSSVIKSKPSFKIRYYIYIDTSGHGGLSEIGGDVSPRTQFVENNNYYYYSYTDTNNPSFWNNYFKGEIGKTFGKNYSGTFTAIFNINNIQISSTIEIQTAVPALHISGKGYGVGVGCYVKGTASNPEFRSAFPFYPDAGIKYVDGGGIYNNSGYRIDKPLSYIIRNKDFYNESGVTNLDFIRIGDIVFMHGYVRLQKNLTASERFRSIDILAREDINDDFKWIKPKFYTYSTFSLLSINGNILYNIYVDTSGRIYIEFGDIPESYWYYFDMMWIGN